MVGILDSRWTSGSVLHSCRCACRWHSITICSPLRSPSLWVGMFWRSITTSVLVIWSRSATRLAPSLRHRFTTSMLTYLQSTDLVILLLNVCHRIHGLLCFRRISRRFVGIQWRLFIGGTAAAVPPPFRPGDPALCGSHPLVTPYYCRLGDLLCLFVYPLFVYYFVYICICVFSVFFFSLPY